MGFLSNCLSTIGRFLRRLAHYLWLLLKVATVLAATVLLGAGLFLGWLSLDADKRLENVAALTSPEKAKLPQPITVYSSDGKLIGSSGAQQRIVVTGDNISPFAKKATVAIEDQRFYQHHGIDFQAIARALWVNIRAGGRVQGASTITQQYVRNVYLNFEKTSLRKMREAALALQLEGIWGKKRILDAYLNTVYFANGCYGIEAAARYYFNVKARDLTPAQSASLIAIVKDPSAFEPRAHPDINLQRRNLILDEMFSQGYLTQAQVLVAKRTRLVLRKTGELNKISDANRQLLSLVLTELDKTIDPVDRARGGLRVESSFNMAQIYRARIQLAAVYKGLPANNRPVVASSFLDPRTGRIILLAHSRKKGYFNFSTQAIRQPGSTVKAFTFAALLAKGQRADSPVDNSPLEVKDKNKGTYTLTPSRSVSTVGDALRFSQNPAFWRLYQAAGPKKVLALEKKLGLTKMDSNPAAALGGTRLGTSSLRLASAYGVFAFDGLQKPPHAIVSVRDLLDNLVYRDDYPPRRVIPDEYARQENAALVRVVGEGFPQLKESVTISDSREVAGKTGTTEDNADAWFVGYTPQLAGAVWTGYPKSRQSLQSVAGEAVFGATVPAQNWNEIAAALLKNKPVLKFPRPRNVQLVPRVVDFSLAAARARLEMLGFSNISEESKFNEFRPSQRVLSLDPAPGSWVSRNKLIRLVYTINEKPMPSLVGGNYIDLLENEGRFFDLSVRLVASGRPTGTVLQQSILPGTPVTKNQQLAIVLSTKRAPAIIKTEIKKVPYYPSSSELQQLRQEAARQARRETIPDLLGLSLADAQNILESISMRPRATGTGEVQAMDPSPGNRVARGTTVRLIGN